MRTRHFLGALGCATLLALPAVLHAQFTVPNIVTTSGDVVSVLGKNLFINHGLVGVGRISASILDGFGESFGSVSGLQITDWTKVGDNSYTGTFNILPDRGYNSGTFFSDYAARIQRVSFVFTPHTGRRNRRHRHRVEARGPEPDHDDVDAERREVPVLRRPCATRCRLRPVSIPDHGFDDALRRDAAVCRQFHRTERAGRNVDEPRRHQQAAARLRGARPEGRRLRLRRRRVRREHLLLQPQQADRRRDRPPEALRPRRTAGGNYYFGASTPDPIDGRRNNQGFEGVALSPDGTRLFALAAERGDAGQRARATRTRLQTRLLVYDVSGEPDAGGARRRVRADAAHLSHLATAAR